MRLHHVTLILAAVLSANCAGLQLPGSTTGTGSPAGTVPTAAANAPTDIVRYTNEARARSGLPSLVSSARLMEAARLHAEQMASSQRSAHEIPGSRYPTLQSRLEAVSYLYASAAENIAWNQSSPQSAVNSWMNSAGHRANILDPNLTEIGAAMARSSKGEPYWIQVFGRPR